QNLSGQLLEYLEPKTKVSVAWFKIKKPGLKATELQEKMMNIGVYILPGNYFFWSDHEKGEEYIRIALAREPDMFATAVQLMKKVVNE
ncbi:MAG: aspartate/tyrosine/aromatic aminotransferase, partial [Symploca sp. SIO2E6]|nr:aspartate/tyrosine/aromatic aminotransferase [Symploca sp. SIO2E6]